MFMFHLNNIASKGLSSSKSSPNDSIATLVPWALTISILPCNLDHLTQQTSLDMTLP